MASGIDRNTGRRISGWPYTVQCLEVIATTQIGERVMREYVGSLNPGLLVKENLTRGPLERWIYALLLTWELWVPMFDIQDWQYISLGDERDGGFGIEFFGAHMPNAHLQDYSLESNRRIRAMIADHQCPVSRPPACRGRSLRLRSTSKRSRQRGLASMWINWPPRVCRSMLMFWKPMRPLQ